MRHETFPLEISVNEGLRDYSFEKNKAELQRQMGNQVIKVWRYMSPEEFDLYSKGVEIVGASQRKYRSSVKDGVCFLPEIIEVSKITYDRESGYSDDSYLTDPKYAHNFLNGIVDDSGLLVEFETKMPPRIEYGVYANPTTCAWDDYIDIKEYSYPSYDRETHTAISYGFEGIFKDYIRYKIYRQEDETESL